MKQWIAIALLGSAGPAVADDTASFFSFNTDRLEQHFEHEDHAVEMQAGWGNDERRYVLRLEGVKPDGDDFEGELQLLYSKPFAAYWDWQIGLEAALHGGDATPGLVAGLVGEMPYRIETEARLTLNDHGDVFIHAEFERDFLITRKLVLQPRIGFRVGDHDENIATELRLRYEVTRKFVPYIGISWERLFGDARTDVTTSLAGVSFWF